MKPSLLLGLLLFISSINVQAGEFFDACMDMSKSHDYRNTLQIMLREVGVLASLGKGDATTLTPTSSQCLDGENRLLAKDSLVLRPTIVVEGFHHTLINPILDIEALTSLKHIRDLSLSATDVDLAPMLQLQSLSKLQLNAETHPMSAGQLHQFDLNIIGKLTQLKALTIRESFLFTNDNPTNISVLANLSELEFLSLSAFGIESVEPLRSLLQLKTLDLRSNLISDISPLTELTELKTLDIAYNKLTDLSPISSLKKLSTIDFRGNQIKDLNGLVGAKSLESIIAAQNNIVDISAVAQLPRLLRLSVHMNQVQNINGLQGHPSLTHLFLGYNRISQLETLIDLPVIQEIHLQENVIQDISSLAKIPVSLKVLNLRKNKISDILPLGKNNIQNLDLTQNNVKEISSLVLMPALTELKLTGNPVENIQALSALKSLTRLSLTATRTASLDPLVDLVDLETLWMVSVDLCTQALAQLQTPHKNSSGKTISLRIIGGQTNCN